MQIKSFYRVGFGWFFLPLLQLKTSLYLLVNAINFFPPMGPTVDRRLIFLASLHVFFFLQEMLCSFSFFKVRNIDVCLNCLGPLWFTRGKQVCTNTC